MSLALVEQLNFEKNMAVGIDGVSVERYSLKDNKISIRLISLLAGLKVPFKGTFSLEMRLEGIADGNYELVINDRKAVRATAKELAKLKVEIGSGGTFRAEL